MAVTEAAPPAGPMPPAGAVPVKTKAPRAPGERRLIAWIFLAPALILLAAIIVYPVIYSLIRSLFQDGPAGTAGSFTWFSNYKQVFTDNELLKAVINNVIWVAIAPAVITMFGLIFAVLSEKIRWATFFKTVLFVPMAISGLAVGVTFSLIYSDQPSRGLANAVTVGIHDIFSENSGYPTVHARDTTVLDGSANKGYISKASFSAGKPALLPMVGLDIQTPPKGLLPAKMPTGVSGVSGVVWNDFSLGGGGKPNQVDPKELGLKGVTVQAVQNGKVVASTTTNAQGQFTFSKLTSGSYQLKLPASNFGQPFTGLSWLGSDTGGTVWAVFHSLITWSIIIAYIWIYAGFAMVLLAAGMAAIPREALEAARIDGATEWQVFRKVTAPLLAPVLVVVLVTLIINVLKVFDVVFIISQSAGANGKDSWVLAVELYNAYGTQKFGVASAIGILLVLLVLPAMIFNVRRFRRENR